VDKEFKTTVILVVLTAVLSSSTVYFLKNSEIQKSRKELDEAKKLYRLMQERPDMNWILW